MAPELHPDAAEQAILRRIQVSPDRVARCVQEILSVLPRHAAAANLPTDGLIRATLDAVGSSLPEIVCIHPSGDPDRGIEAGADYLSWRFAAIEALLMLTNGGALLPMGVPQALPSVRVVYSTLPAGGENRRDAWTFEPTAVSLPRSVRLAPSRAAGGAATRPAATASRADPPQRPDRGHAGKPAKRPARELDPVGSR